MPCAGTCDHTSKAFGSLLLAREGAVEGIALRMWSGRAVQSCLQFLVKAASRGCARAFQEPVSTPQCILCHTAQ
eukprot:scaffold582_cov385-Prasinococcus_capsulatus_cf.AAC.49